ncbi:MAG: RteC domain-containing protein [Paludibacter sp.]|nr:RteC domain-containing protein [Paludibacter sp.]
MDYFILTDTEFFRQITDKDECKLTSAYCDFIKTVFDLCTGSVSRYELLFAMTYTETELQSLCETCRLNPNINKESDPCFLYTRKALSFIRHTLKHMQTQVLTSPSDNINQPSIALYRWTGSTVELVELIYGLVEMRSVDNGETPITELASFISLQFGIEIKDCYSAYVDMKRRKNDSRTYYLDKMRERLNRRMQLDDEREQMRK